MKTETIQLTRASSKGQIVIPTKMRKRLNIKEGSLFLISSEKGVIVMKKISTKINPEDLKTIRLVEEAWKDIEEGRYKVLSAGAFSKELAKW
ncbi:MAG: AbrB/MazE/SpoVT family DNA-binding domain-containing protein [Candidatus Micrarchaeota archaeon]|nr:AbrB/MazE/SpoVT family DNA-binding domain-containing protein [Candidatus Micrarchaeota archaeon]